MPKVRFNAPYLGSTNLKRLNAHLGVLSQHQKANGKGIFIMLDTVKHLSEEDFARFYLYCTDWYGPDSKHFPLLYIRGNIGCCHGVMSRDTDIYVRANINFLLTVTRWIGGLLSLMDHKRGCFIGRPSTYQGNS